ncbi:MAG: hypothetical protein P8008_00945 [Gammaproteobacteria bacterium]
MSAPRKKVLIVNCYFPELREAIKRRNEVPDALAPVLLGGYFSRERCEVKLYNEVNSGFIEVFAPELLSWPDMIVLTGLTAAFDRLLHVTAYARTANQRVIVVAGGHGVRSLPRYSERFFDYSCTGDVEQIQDVIREALGPEYISPEFRPRYDLAYWIKRIGYAESTRNCNFKCSFCSLTGVGLKYQPQQLDYTEAQLEAMGPRPLLFFNDNQLLGSGPANYRSRIAQVQKRREAGQFRYWGGFVTDTFFWDEANIELARETGCMVLFVGVESFENEMWLKSVNKKQNSRMNQVDLIRRCLEAGIIFQYGLVYDPTIQTLEQMYEQLDLICDHPDIPAPNFIFMSIPFPGTPFFHDRFEKGLILPNTHMRDLEGSTLSVQPIDPVEDVVHFIRNGKNFRGYRMRMLKHQAQHLWHYRKHLGRPHKMVSSLTALAIMAPGSFSSPGALFKKKRPRTHVSTTEILDPVYTPRLPVDERYRSWFEPTWITDHEGALNPELEADALATRFKSSTQRTASGEVA